MVRALNVPHLSCSLPPQNIFLCFPLETSLESFTSAPAHGWWDFPAVLIHLLCLWLSVIHFPGRIFVFIIFSNYNNKSWLITPRSSQREVGHVKVETALNLSIPSVLTTRICKLLYFHYVWTSAAIKCRLNWQKVDNTMRKIKNVTVSYDSHHILCHFYDSKCQMRASFAAPANKAVLQYEFYELLIQRLPFSKNWMSQRGSR